MPLIITAGKPLGCLLVRINKTENIVEVSLTNGKTWSSRFTSQNCGIFIDLLYYKGNVFACTSKGLYISTNDGKTFSPRYINLKSATTLKK